MANLLAHLQKLFRHKQEPTTDPAGTPAGTQNRLTLYYSPGCIFCLRVLAAIRILKLDIDRKNTLIEASAREELLRYGGSAMVPCLKIERGKEGGMKIQWMYESADIIDYLEALPKAG